LQECIILLGIKNENIELRSIAYSIDKLVLELRENWSKNAGENYKCLL